MIYILERPAEASTESQAGPSAEAGAPAPARAEPRAWFAYDEADLARKVAATDSLQPWEIYDQQSAREWLELLAELPPGPEAEARFPALCALGQRHGYDAPLYRADHLLGRGMLQAEPVSLRQALEAALAARPGRTTVYWSDEQALQAFEGGDPALVGPAHWHARRALYQQLVALEVLADNQ
jgi:hypothetical protein